MLSKSIQGRIRAKNGFKTLLDNWSLNKIKGIIKIKITLPSIPTSQSNNTMITPQTGNQCVLLVINGISQSKTAFCKVTLMK